MEKDDDGTFPVHISTHELETLHGLNGTKIHLGRYIGHDGKPTGRVQLIVLGQAGWPGVVIETTARDVHGWGRLAGEGHELLPAYMKSSIRKPDYSTERHQPGWPGECPDCGHETDAPYPWWDGDGLCPKCGGDWRLRQAKPPVFPGDGHVVWVQGERGNRLTDPAGAPRVVHFTTGQVPDRWSVRYVCLRHRPCPRNDGKPGPLAYLKRVGGHGEHRYVPEDASTAVGYGAPEVRPGVWREVYWPNRKAGKLYFEVELDVESLGDPSDLDLGVVLRKGMLDAEPAT